MSIIYDTLVMRKQKLKGAVTLPASHAWLGDSRAVHKWSLQMRPMFEGWGQGARTGEEPIPADAMDALASHPLAEGLLCSRPWGSR